MSEGLKEGWMHGFDDGTEYGIKKIYNEAISLGLDLSVLDIKDLIDPSNFKKDKLSMYCLWFIVYV